MLNQLKLSLLETYQVLDLAIFWVHLPLYLLWLFCNSQQILSMFMSWNLVGMPFNKKSVYLNVTLYFMILFRIIKEISSLYSLIFIYTRENCMNVKYSFSKVCIAKLRCIPIGESDASAMKSKKNGRTRRINMKFCYLKQYLYISFFF